MKAIEELRILSDSWAERVAALEEEKKKKYETLLKERVDKIIEEAKKVAEKGKREFSVIEKIKFDKGGSHNLKTTRGVDLEELLRDMSVEDQGIYQKLLDEDFNLHFRFHPNEYEGDPLEDCSFWSLTMTW